VFINGMVASDARLPFWRVKKSGTDASCRATASQRVHEHPDGLDRPRQNISGCVREIRSSIHRPIPPSACGPLEPALGGPALVVTHLRDALLLAPPLPWRRRSGPRLDELIPRHATRPLGGFLRACASTCAPARVAVLHGGARVEVEARDFSGQYLERPFSRRTIRTRACRA